MPNLQDTELEEAHTLWRQTGWNRRYRLSLADFTRSWRASPVKKGIVKNGRIVAIGRANTDGVVYAMVHDIVVHPEHRGQGLGKRIVLEVVAELRAMPVRSIQLMAAEGQTRFYEKLGFEIRPTDGPGMQYLWHG